MANKDFGVKKIELIGSSGTPNLTSPTNLNLNANTVAISTDVTIGGKVQSDVIVGTGYSVGIGSTLPQQALDVSGTIRATTFVKSDGSTVGAGDTANIVTGIITAVSYYGDGSTLSGISNVSIGDTAPSPATDNSLWWSSALAKGFIRYNDGNSSQWVEFSPSGGGGSGNIVGLSTSGNSYFTNIDVNNQSDLTNLNVSGVSTLAGDVIVTGGLVDVQSSGVPAVISHWNSSKHLQLSTGDNGGGLNITDVNYFAINHQPYADRGTTNNLTERLRITTAGNAEFAGSGSFNGLDVTGHTETDTLRVTGVTTLGVTTASTLKADEFYLGSTSSSYRFYLTNMSGGSSGKNINIRNNYSGGSIYFDAPGEHRFFRGLYDNMIFRVASGCSLYRDLGSSGEQLMLDTSDSNHVDIYQGLDLNNTDLTRVDTLGIGTDSAQAPIHVTVSDVPGFTPASVYDKIIIESNEDPGGAVLQLVSNATGGVSEVQFSDNVRGVGQISYYHDTDHLRLIAGVGLTISTNTEVVGVLTATTVNVGDSYEVTSGLGTFTASAGVSTNIASFNASDYKVVEYKLWIQHANGIQSQKVIIMHDDNDVYTQESDIFYSNTLLIGAGATISGGTVSLALTAESGVNGITTYRYSRESLV